MKKLIIILLLCVSGQAFSQYDMSHLYIRNVDWGMWNYDLGSIDTLLIEIKPKGIYTEIGLTFDFSTRGTYFSPGDSLEAEMMFILPEDAEVTDMWLWVNDSIVVAGIYDKWTATQVYEDIVDRRVDPSILYKYDGFDWWTGMMIEGYYMWKIFPLMTTLPRKAKFTYLLRSEEYVSRYPDIELPYQIMKLSSQDIQKVKLRFYPREGMTEPRIAQEPAHPFTYSPGGIDTAFYEADLTALDYTLPLTLTYRHDVTAPVYAVWTDSAAGEKLFQLQLLPEELFGFSAHKKAVILFDFVAANCNAYTGTTLLAEVSNQLMKKFDADDSVCFMFSGPVTTVYGGGWIPADSLSLATAFSTFNNGWFNSFSSLTTVLSDGINFIRNHQNEGSIVLISSDKTHGDLITANNLLSNLTGLIDSSDIPVHIADLNTTYSPYHYIGQQTYYGNAYLYFILSAQTSGDYYSLRESGGTAVFTGLFDNLGGYFNNFTVYVFTQGGYTYSTYTLPLSGGLYFYDKAIQITGKYTGDLPFHLMAFADMEGVLLSYDDDITGGTADPGDRSTRQMWALQYLRDMASLNPGNTVINQIIATSMAERVLTDYTAFLALEPGEGPFENPNGQPTALEETPDSGEDALNAFIYPNPVSISVQIGFTLTTAGQIKIEIIDLAGRALMVIAEDQFQEGSHTLTADLSGLSRGVYLIRFSMADGKNTRLKLVKL